MRLLRIHVRHHLPIRRVKFAQHHTTSPAASRGIIDPDTAAAAAELRQKTRPGGVRGARFIGEAGEIFGDRLAQPIHILRRGGIAMPASLKASRMAIRRSVLVLPPLFRSDV